MDRSPCLPDLERLQGLWSASGVEAAGEHPAPPAAPRRIRFGAAPAPAPQPSPVAAPAAPPPAPVPALQRAAVPAPPPPPAARLSPVLTPALAAAAALASASTPPPARPELGPPLPPRVPGPPSPAAGVAAPPAVPAPALAPAGPPRPAIPALPDEALAAQVFASARGIDSRLQRLLEYAGRTLSASAAFVADGDGLTVASLRSSEALAAISAPLRGVQEKISAFVPASAEGATVVELEEQGVLQMVWAATVAGRLALGMVLPAPLDRGSTRKLRRLVQLAVDTNANGKGSA